MHIRQREQYKTTRTARVLFGSIAMLVMYQFFNAIAQIDSEQSFIDSFILVSNSIWGIVFIVPLLIGHILLVYIGDWRYLKYLSAFNDAQLLEFRGMK